MSNAQVNNIIAVGGGRDGSGPLSVTPATDWDKLVTLVSSMYTTTTTANNYVSFGNFSGIGASASQFQVPTGKTFVGRGFMFFGSIQTSNIMTFGYGTAALIAHSTATAPTGVFHYGPSTAVEDGGILLTSTNNSNHQWFPFIVKFPSDSFPFVRYAVSADNVSLNMIGTLE